MTKALSSASVAIFILALVVGSAAAQGPPEPPPTTGDVESAIAFISNRDGEDYDLYVLDPATGDTRRVTDNDDVDWYPAWSPDGKYLILGASREGTDYEIYVIEVESGDEQQITDNDADDLQPAWVADSAAASPGGGVPEPPSAESLSGELAFVSDRDGDQEIYLMSIDGSNLRQVTNNETRDKDPAWSPDGSSIFFASNEDGDFEIYVAAVDEGGVTDKRQLTDNDAQDESPSLSPSGQYMAFSANREGNYEIYVMNLYTDATRQLTNQAGHDLNPTWSPDGEQIAFVSDRDGDYEIYVMDTDGENVRQLTNNDADDLGPVWAPEAVEPEEPSPTEGPAVIVTSTPPPEEGCRITNNDPGNVNVRSGPGTVYSIVGVLNPGESVTATGYNDRWFRINFRGVEAWIADWVTTSEGDCADLVLVPAPPTPVLPTSTPVEPSGPVIEFWADDTNVSPGDCTDIHWRVENIEAVYFEGTGVTGSETREVCPGSTTTYSLEVHLRDGTTETRSITITVGGTDQPDLYVSEFSLNPSTPVQGEPVDVRVGVYNQGSAAVSGTSFRIEWWAGEGYSSPACSWNLDSLAASGGRILTCTYAGYPSPYGSIDTVVRVDTGNTVAESNETNNVRTETISVSAGGGGGGSQPDLYVSEFSLNPSTPVQGEPVQVRIGVYNQGSAAVSGTSFRIEWWAGEHFSSPACSWNLSSLAASGGRILTCTYSGYSSWYGSINTVAKVDTGNTIAESNEANNTRSKSISVSRP